MEKRNLKEILANGTPKQKALLLIQNEEDEQRLSKGAFLTKQDIDAIMNSVRKDEKAARELSRYLTIAQRFQENRFRFYGLQECLKTGAARIAGLIYIWELSEQYVEYNNTLLGLITAKDNKGAKVQHQKDVEKCIYQHTRSWNKYVTIKKKEGLDELELDITPLKEQLDVYVSYYKSNLSVAKAFYIATYEFVDKYKAAAFIPRDVKDMIDGYKVPSPHIPEIYRRDKYLELLHRKGADDRDVKYRERYAIVPAWEELEPYGLDNAREALSL